MERSDSVILTSIRGDEGICPLQPFSKPLHGELRVEP